MNLFCLILSFLFLLNNTFFHVFTTFYVYSVI
uniref:Uncharacterized protein n=1 Tax=Siphoviridae sp. ctm7X10 TaxID=2827929 RepID=A0A8S5S5N1_9CAUD|nr:MAG TPA: hypothetical protein [Siphoviridae sp. ctm7X10]